VQNFSHGGDKFLNFFSNEIVMIMEQKNKRIKGANMLSELSQLWGDQSPQNLTRQIVLLIEEIEDLNKTPSKYSKILIWLTIIMTIAVFVQIYLLLIPK
jgi:hypothetical protein